MKTKLRMAAAVLALPALAYAQVGVSVNVGEPGFYGRIDIGDYQPPRLIYAEPLLIERVQVRPAPIYLRVPPGHAKHWDRHCRDYGACARPVYFVEDDWYERVYVHEYQAKHGGPGKRKGKGKGHDKH